MATLLPAGKLTLSIFRGDNTSLEIPTAATFDLTNASSALFTVKRSLLDPDRQALIQKALGQGLTILDAQLLEVQIVPRDTADLCNLGSRLLWDVQVQDGNGCVYTVACGYLSVLLDVTELTMPSIPIYTHPGPAAESCCETVSINQPGHGMALTNGLPVPVRYEIPNWVQAAGDSLAETATLFVIDVLDSNTLELAYTTTAEVDSHPFTVGQPLYLANAGLGVGGTPYTQNPADSVNDQIVGMVASPTQIVFYLQPAPIASGGAVQQTYRDEFTATSGQTVFTLTFAPINPDGSKLYVNAGKYDITDDYTISGTTLTWLNSEFTLDAGDNIELYYQY